MNARMFQWRSLETGAIAITVEARYRYAQISLLVDLNRPASQTLFEEPQGRWPVGSWPVIFNIYDIIPVHCA
jgi:hypothetical protein